MEEIDIKKIDIEKILDMFEDDYEDNSPSRYKVFRVDGQSDDDAPYHMTYLPAFTMQPHWDGGE